MATVATDGVGDDRRGRVPWFRSIVAVLALVVAGTAGTVPGAPGAGADGPVDGAADRIVVALADAEAADRVAGRVAGRVARRVQATTAVVEVPDGTAPAAIARLRADRRVRWVEPDRVLHATRVPNDPCYTSCADSDQWNLRMVGSEGAWDVTTGAPGVVVAVLDTGVDPHHVDLGGKVDIGPNLSASPDPVDRNGHGTHVVGIVGALTGNATGVAGLGWNTRVRSIKVLDDAGAGFASDIARGVDDAIRAGVRVVNLSLAGEQTLVLRDAVQRARAAGIVVVAAAGNEAQTQPRYPAAHEGVLGVTSIGPTGRLSGFSNNGTWVDLAAPGERVLSTVPGGYGWQSGTSMAAPHVSATAALMAAAHPGITGSQIESIIESTAASMEGAGTVVRYGRVDAARAVSAAAALPPTPPPGTGYRLVASDGGIFSFGSASFHGSTGGIVLNSPIVGMATTPTRRGYWLVAADGGIFAFGDASFHGSTGGIRLQQPIVGMAATPSGGGYWLAARDGGVFAFGDAAFLGAPPPPNRPVVGIAATPTGSGYWLVASDGGLFAFGDAPFHGSTGGIILNEPIVGMAPTPAGDGYWLVASDGGIFAFGTAPFYGSTGAIRLNEPIVGMAAPTPGGYWLVARDGGIFAFGSAPFYGSTGDIRLNSPIVGIGA